MSKILIVDDAAFMRMMIKDSLKKGIANVYSKNKKLYFQLPDGTITQEKPKQYNFNN